MKPSTFVAWFILATWLFLGLFGPWLVSTPDVRLDQSFQPPGTDFLLGTDALGRDIVPLLVGGARSALIVGLLSVGFAGCIGTILGLVSGYRRGLFDMAVMRVIDILLAFPGILLAIAIAAVLGPKVINIVFALALIGWTGFARLVRGQTLSLRTTAYVEAAKTLGVAERRVILAHILPNVFAPIVVHASFSVAGAILAESSLSFLGLGDPSLPSWGALLAEGVRNLRTAPYISMSPGIAIFLVILSLNIVGDALTEKYSLVSSTPRKKP